MEFLKVRKKPVEVEAFQLTENFLAEKVGESDLTDSFGNYYAQEYFGDRPALYYDNCAYIPTLEGNMKANIGDWIIKGVNGEIYPCKDDIFKKTYEIV